jgi:hypothetical protein
MPVSLRQSTIDKLHYNIGSLAGIKLNLEFIQASEKLTDDGARELEKTIDYIESLCIELRDVLCSLKPA